MSAAPATWLPVTLYATLPLWPLLGAVLAGLLLALRQKRAAAHWPVILGAGVAAVLGVVLFFDLGQLHRPAPDVETPPPATAAHGEPPAAHAGGPAGAPAVGFTYTVYNWISLGAGPSLAGGHWLPVNFFFDNLTGLMLLFVTVVSLMVVIYSIGYMRDHHGHPEPGYERFFAFMGLFVFSMCALVMAGNFVLLYLGWEAVGLCSYLLIGFYYRRPAAAEAAKKAFIVNRIGDFGFAVGLFALYQFMRGHVQPGENPLDYAVVFKYAPQLAAHTFAGASQATWVALLLLCGAVGKSAQFPLHVWLPDAMEGPTPVSALIHAATMVTAGIYLIARCTPIFQASALALDVILVIGLIGAVLTATIAMAQYDLKRILAYSTISQLAFMFVALGASAPAAGLFHVFTHAWFKALLFLAAGSVMHALHGVIDVRQFSGLRRVLPRTYALMLIGCLALAGFPLLAGFWSKDEIIHSAFARHWVVGVILLFAAGLTAYYTFRMLFLAFHGPLRLPAELAGHPHESPPVMLRPLYVLAAGAILAGYLGVSLHAGGQSFLGIFAPHGPLHGYLEHSTIATPRHAAGAAHGGSDVWLMYVSALVALAGMGLAWVRYGRAPVIDPDRTALNGLFEVWHARYYLDELYDAALVRPLRRAGRAFFATDNYFIDGLIWFVTAIPRAGGAALGLLQRGALQGYALGMLIGLTILILVWQLVRPLPAG